MYKLSKSIKVCLEEIGIQKDDIQELEEKGRILLDIEDAKQISCEFIEQEISFKCELDNIDALMYKITLI